ncbi:hypothetical protein JOM56_008231 [Amanita muscaria]
MVKNHLVCKRRAPFPLSSEDWVNEKGEWGPKHLCEFLNNWNSLIMQALCANHDIKLILQGALTSTITWYITNYATKKQSWSHNASALLAKKFIQHSEMTAGNQVLIDRHKLLIEQCAIALTFEREFGAPEIVSYLMGWGDHYESHCYSIIFLDAIMNTLKQTFPALREEKPILGNEEDCEKQEDNNLILSMDDGACELKDLNLSFNLVPH